MKGFKTKKLFHWETFKFVFVSGRKRLPTWIPTKPLVGKTRCWIPHLGDASDQKVICVVASHCHITSQKRHLFSSFFWPCQRLRCQLDLILCRLSQKLDCFTADNNFTLLVKRSSFVKGWSKIWLTFRFVRHSRRTVFAAQTSRPTYVSQKTTQGIKLVRFYIMLRWFVFLTFKSVFLALKKSIIP